MTLLLAIIQPQGIVYVGDRRLSVERKGPNGPEYDVVEENYSKLIVVDADDGQFVIGITGIGRTSDGFSTVDWLWETVKNISSDRTPIYEVLENLKNELTSQFQLFSLPAQHLRLTLLIAGFVYDGATHVPRCWRISNFENPDGTQNPEARDDFNLWSEGPEDGYLVAAAGAVSCPNRGDIQTIERLIRDGAHWKAVEYKAYHTVSKARLRGAAGTTIGGNLNAVQLRLNEPDEIRTFYYSEDPTRKIYAVPAIIASGVDQAWGLSAGEMVVGNLMPFITVPHERRNSPCPCGSGLRYRMCHAKLQYSYLPLSIEQETSDRRISIRCYGATPA